MSSVPVSITWSGTTPAAHPDKAVVTLSLGQKSVQWTSDRAFSITVQDQNIDAEQKNGRWVANSHDFDAPNNIPYVISLPGSAAGFAPQIEILT